MDAYRHWMFEACPPNHISLPFGFPTISAPAPLPHCFSLSQKLSSCQKLPAIARALDPHLPDEILMETMRFLACIFQSRANSRLRCCCFAAASSCMDSTQ
uniref:Uncharacterized protein n=1 Tax=Eutreptiella gymnastica TaxID=73025 RepID=A0A7S4G226_9EUGL